MTFHRCRENIPSKDLIVLQIYKWIANGDGASFDNLAQVDNRYYQFLEYFKNVA